MCAFSVDITGVGLEGGVNILAPVVITEVLALCGINRLFGMVGNCVLGRARSLNLPNKYQSTGLESVKWAH